MREYVKFALTLTVVVHDDHAECEDIEGLLESARTIVSSVERTRGCASAQVSTSVTVLGSEDRQ